MKTLLKGGQVVSGSGVSAADVLLDGETIYRMASLTADLSTPSTDRFILPDGTVLLDE